MDTKENKIDKSFFLKVFVSPSCPKCPLAKKAAEELAKSITTIILDIETPNGLAEAAAYQVMSVPTFLLIDDIDRGDEEIARWVNLPPSLLDIIKKIQEHRDN